MVGRPWESLSETVEAGEDQDEAGLGRVPPVVRLGYVRHAVVQRVQVVPEVAGELETRREGDVHLLFVAPSAGAQRYDPIPLAAKPHLGIAQRSIVSQPADEPVAGHLEVQPVAEDVVGGECGHARTVVRDEVGSLPRPISQQEAVAARQRL